MSATTDKTYNGWTNYETWAVGLHLDGNYDGEATYLEVLELVRNISENAEATEYSTLDEMRLYDTADALKDWFEESLPELDGIVSDLLGAAVSEINWRELAASKLAEIAEES